MVALQNCHIRRTRLLLILSQLFGSLLACMVYPLDLPPPPLSLHLHSVSKAQLAKLQAIFENIDVSKSGTVYCSEILSVVDMAQSPFTDNLFKLVGEQEPVDHRSTIDCPCPFQEPDACACAT